MANETSEEKSPGFVDDRVDAQVEEMKKKPVIGQKNLFEVDPKTKKYLRKYADIVEIDNERLVLRIDGEDWALPSAYDVLDLVEGDWILGHAYPGLDGKKKLFPLGPDNEFIETRDARNAFLPTDITSAKDAEEVKAAQEEQNDLQAQFLRLAGEIAGVHTTTTEFGQAINQIIQNATSIAKIVTTATPSTPDGQVTAARAMDVNLNSKGRAPVTIRPRDPARDAAESKKGKKRRGRGMKRVQSHFRGQE